MQYLVTWVIDVDAKSPEEAAQMAFDLKKNSETTACIFDVTNTETNETTQVDLDEGWEYDEEPTATDDEIWDVAEPRLIHNIQKGGASNIEEIKDDTECPFDFKTDK